MHLDLGMQRLRKQPAFRVVNGHAGFIARGLDAEDAHGPEELRRRKSEIIQGVADIPLIGYTYRLPL
jgi:hypothetical protein